MKHETQLVLGCFMAGALGAVFVQGAAMASRDSSGNYTLPTGNPVVSGTAINSTVHNNTMSDLGTEMTDSLSRSNKGAMLAPLRGYVGSVSAPGFTWSGDTNTGLYWVSADSFASSCGGTAIQTWSNASSVRSTTVNASMIVTGHSSAGASISVTGVAGYPGIVATGASTYSAIQGTGDSGPGLAGLSSTGYGASLSGNSTRAPLHIQAQSVTPSSPSEGDLYVDSDDHKLYLYTGSAWVVVGTQS